MENGDLRLYDLAKELGLSDATAVSSAKFVLLEYHRKKKSAEEYKKFKDKVESWFAKSGRIKFFKSEHLEEFRALLNEVPHRKGKGGNGNVVAQGTNNEERSVGAFGGNQGANKTKLPFTGLGNIELIMVAVQILESWSAQMAKDRQSIGLESEYWKKFYEVQEALVNQAKEERNFMDTAQKYVAATQRLAEVVAKYHSK